MSDVLGRGQTPNCSQPVQLDLSRDAVTGRYGRRRAWKTAHFELSVGIAGVLPILTSQGLRAAHAVAVPGPGARTVRGNF
jgi:hypothetical protein